MEIPVRNPSTPAGVWRWAAISNLVRKFSSPEPWGQHVVFSCASLSGRDGGKGWRQNRNTSDWC